MQSSPHKIERRGAVLPLAVFLVIVILAMAAFAVDVGYIILVRAQLQKAADAAALAAVEQLMQPYVQYSSPGQTAAQQTQILNNATAAALAQAKKFAGFNRAGSVSSLALNDADVVFGFLDAQNNFSPNPPDTRFPNSVQVTVRRDAQANGALTLIFGSLLGKGSASVTALGQATMMTDPNNFTGSKGIDSLFIPVALDVRIWKQFMQNGTSPSANNQVLTGPNGQPELQVYPDSSQFGSFGLVSPGPPASDTPSYRAWIDNGPTPADLTYLDTHNLLPVSPQQPAYWAAGPGMKSTLQTDFASIMGEARLVPLYDGSLGSQGNGYPIVGFAGVTITQATGRGSNMNISVQPALVIDPTAVGGSPAGTSGLPPTFSFAPARLTK